MGSLPPGDPWPPAPDRWDRAQQLGAERPTSAYIHVPFCTVRCGYCDFNTYTTEFGPGADRATYAQSVRAEIAHSARRLSLAPPAPLQTVFFGGGTPTLLDPAELGLILAELSSTFGLAPGAEITVETNPETLTEDRVRQLADLGITRLSVGMQSAVPEVLSVLDRQHRPEQLPLVAQWARAAGLSYSVDLIYGAPTETVAQWETSLRAALALDPDHLSAYSLIVEPGTKLAAQVARGDLPAPDDDEAAEKYQLADQLLAEAGYRWYEISNFARPEPGEEGLVATELTHASKHNLAYWRDWNWWGYGPGAHSHWGDLRWWNVKHPRAYAGRLDQGLDPALAGETLDEPTRALEALMLGIRTAEGLALGPELSGVDQLLGRGLVELNSAGDRLTLTLSGRLLADLVTRTLAGWE
ncbi:radical SAM family heme chaperone HemW [Actinomyces sp. F1_1611]